MQVSPTNKREVYARKLVQLYTCANDGGPGSAILLRTERKKEEVVVDDDDDDESCRTISLSYR